jgi:DNA-binding NarL/FixJ family response regulator
MDVVLVDEHEALRDGLEIMLARRAIRTVGTAGSAAAAGDLLRRLHPDVAIIEVELPDETGVRLVRRLHHADPELAILIYTGVTDVGLLGEALQTRARGFVLKRGGIAQLVGALRRVAQGTRYVDPAIIALLAGDTDAPPSRLTARERQVFDLLAQDLTGEEIARELTIAGETVRTHIRNGMDKLHAHTRTGAVVEALRTGEIELRRSARPDLAPTGAPDGHGDRPIGGLRGVVDFGLLPRPRQALRRRG